MTVQGERWSRYDHREVSLEISIIAYQWHFEKEKVQGMQCIIITVTLFNFASVYFHDIREADIIAKVNRHETLILPL